MKNVAKGTDNMPQSKSIDWQAAVIAEREKAVKMFDAAVRRYRKMLVEEAAGADLGPKLLRARSALDDRCAKPEILSDIPTRERCYEVMTALRQEMNNAIEAGYQARKRQREIEVEKLYARERQEREARKDPVLRAYERELAERTRW